MNPFILIDGKLISVGRIVSVTSSRYGGSVIILDGDEDSKYVFPDLTVKAIKELIDAHIAPPKAVVKPRVNFGEQYTINNTIHTPPVGEPVL